MPYFEWSDALALNIASIDEQHRLLVDMINDLHDAVAESGQSCPAADPVERLRAYAAEHFHIEEGYMQTFDYPDFETHRLEHEGFLIAVQGFEKACTLGQADAAEVLVFLKQWLETHISDVDRQLGLFLADHLR